MSRHLDTRAVTARMLALEEGVGEDDRAEVPVIDVLASLLGVEPTEEMGQQILTEVERSNSLAANYYSVVVRQSPDHPAVVGLVAFMQGVTYARAVADVLDA